MNIVFAMGPRDLEKVCLLLVTFTCLTPFADWFTFSDAKASEYQSRIFLFLTGAILLASASEDGRRESIQSKYFSTTNWYFEVKSNDH